MTGPHRGMMAQALALLVVASPALGLAKAAPAAVASAPLPGRWLLVEVTPELTGGIGLNARLPAAGGGDASVAEVGCARPLGIYVGADGLKAKAGLTVLTLRLDGHGYDLPLLPKQEGPRLEAFAATPAGFLDALQAAHTWQFVYGDQASAVLAAPDPLVADAFLAVCRKIEGEHGQGS